MKSGVAIELPLDSYRFGLDLVLVLDIDIDKRLAFVLADIVVAVTVDNETRRGGDAKLSTWMARHVLLLLSEGRRVPLARPTRRLGM